MFDFGIRNVQTNGQVLFVHLPANWCDNVGTKKGSRVHVFMDEEKNLVIKPVEDKTYV